jgi:hypothetical protein
MPIGVRIDLPGATLEWYDEVIEAAGFLPGGPIPTDALSHWVAPTEDGICIVEVWESREAFKSNAKRRMGEVMAEVGFPADTTIEFFDIHNYLPGKPRRG